MKFEVNPSDKDSAEILVTPSHKNGSFIVRDNIYGMRVVRQLFLSNVSEQNVTAIEVGVKGAGDNLLEADPNRAGGFRAVGSGVLQFEIEVPGSKVPAIGTVTSAQEVTLSSPSA